MARESMGHQGGGNRQWGAQGASRGEHGVPRRKNKQEEERGTERGKQQGGARGTGEGGTSNREHGMESTTQG